MLRVRLVALLVGLSSMMAGVALANGSASFSQGYQPNPSAAPNTSVASNVGSLFLVASNPSYPHRSDGSVASDPNSGQAAVNPNVHVTPIPVGSPVVHTSGNQYHALFLNHVNFKLQNMTFQSPTIYRTVFPSQAFSRYVIQQQGTYHIYLQNNFQVQYGYFSWPVQTYYDQITTTHYTTTTYTTSGPSLSGWILTPCTVNKPAPYVLGLPWRGYLFSHDWPSPALKASGILQSASYSNTYCRNSSLNGGHSISAGWFVTIQGEPVTHTRTTSFTTTTNSGTYSLQTGPMTWHTLSTTAMNGVYDPSSGWANFSPTNQWFWVRNIAILKPRATCLVNQYCSGPHSTFRLITPSVTLSNSGESLTQSTTN